MGCDQPPDVQTVGAGFPELAPRAAWHDSPGRDSSRGAQPGCCSIEDRTPSRP